MAKVIKFFTQRWVVIFLGLCALSLIIHLVGPNLSFGWSEGESVTPLDNTGRRWVLTLLMFLIWGAIELAGFVRSTIAANRLKQDAAGLDTSQADHQVGQLESAFLKAVDALEKKLEKDGQAQPD